MNNNRSHIGIFVLRFFRMLHSLALILAQPAMFLVFWEKYPIDKIVSFFLHSFIYWDWLAMKISHLFVELPSERVHHFSVSIETGWKAAVQTQLACEFTHVHVFFEKWLVDLLSWYQNANRDISEGQLCYEMVATHVAKIFGEEKKAKCVSYN